MSLLDEDAVRDLGIEDADDILVLVVINARGSLTESTANLAAPLLINPATRCPQQVVLEDPALPLAAPLAAA